ncbi:flagellar motor switch protein FliG [Rhodobacterales bacterium HKCCE3408]|nr:flagellar motor switch protein FliG [Rhodobacterales bacterium HKCCE3408]
MDDVLEGPAAAPARRRGDRVPAQLTQGQKAAVIVRLLLMHEVPLPLERLAARQQERLARCMTEIRRIDPMSLHAVVDEFTAALDGMALTFPRGLPDALEMLEPYLSPSARDELKDAASKANRGEAWDRIAELDMQELLHLVGEESAEVCAILLSKLPVAKAAQLLAELPPDRAEVITHTVALTGTVGPHTVNRIGRALVAQVDARPAPAFRSNAADRVGLILNSATRKLRDAMLTALDQRDTDFAEAVRRTIFTFDHIPKRLDAGDIPAVLRAVENDTLNLALAAALEQFPLSADFILENISKRMAETLREEAVALGTPSEEEGEAAMTAVITAIRQLEATGQIKLADPATGG